MPIPMYSAEEIVVIAPSAIVNSMKKLTPVVFLAGILVAGGIVYFVVHYSLTII